MGTTGEVNAWKMLEDELDRTAVISDKFKGTIYAIASKMAEQARERGREEGRSMAKRDEVLGAPLLPSEERYLIEAGRLSDRGLDDCIDELSHYFTSLLSGEHVPAIERQARQLAAALLMRVRRGGLYLTSDPSSAEADREASCSG